MAFTYFGAYVVSFLLLTIVLWLLVDFVQKYLYDETAANMLPRAAGGAAILAFFAVLIPSDSDHMLSLWSVIVHPPAWVLVFRFIFLIDIGFSLLIGLGTGVIALPLVTMTYQSIFPSLGSQ